MFNIAVTLEIDYAAKTIRAVDNTDYSELNFANIAVNGEGTILAPDGSSIFVGSLIDISGGDTTSAWYNLPTDNDGNILPGTYALLYAPRFVVIGFAVDQFTTGPNTIWISGENWENVLAQPDNGVGVIIASATTPGNNGTKTLTGVKAVWNGSETEIIVSNTLTAEAGGSATISFNTKYATTAEVDVNYTNANIVVPCINATYDCRSTRNGQIIWSYDVDLPAGSVILSRNWTIEYPRFLKNPVTPPAVTSTAQSVTISTLAWGTWNAQLVLEIQVTQPDGLIYTYTTTASREFKVSCAGSICALFSGMKCFFDKYASMQASNQPVQAYVNTAALINGYYALIVEAQKCSDNDAYNKYYAALKELLSDCDCHCDDCGDCNDCGGGCGGGCDDCQDSSVGWVDNGSDAYSNDLSEAIFAAATPISPSGVGLLPDDDTLSGNAFGQVDVSSAYFQFAAELASLGLTVGKRFVDIAYKAYSPDAGFGTRLSVGGNSIVSHNLDQDYYAEVFVRIGTKRSGNDTIFTVQAHSKVNRPTGETETESFYDVFTNLITVNQTLPVLHTFLGTAPSKTVVYMAQITPLKVK